MKEYIMQQQEYDRTYMYVKRRELVRCFNCKHGNESDLYENYIECPYYESVRDPDWFCADGEAKQ